MHNVMPVTEHKSVAWQRAWACCPGPRSIQSAIALAIKLATTASMAENDACVV